MISPTSFSLKITVAIQGCLWFHVSFWNICSSSMKYVMVSWQELHWVCNGLGSMDILMMLILPIYEYGMCFHLFVSSSISFFSIWYLSKYWSFTSLVKLIPRYFIIFEAIVNGIVFLISLAYKNASDFWILILCYPSLLNSLTSSGSFLM